MITMPYATVMAAIFAAAVLGATGAWVLCGALDQNRVLVTRTQRWQSRVSHPSRSGRSTLDILLKRMSSTIALRSNELRVRRALRRTERLLRQHRRMHTGAHRFNAAVHPVQRQFAGMPAGWLPRRAPVLAALTASPALALTDRPSDECVPSAAPAETVTVIAQIDNDVLVVETSPRSYRPIRSHRPGRDRRPEAGPATTATRPKVPRQRAARSARVLDTVPV